VSASKIGILVFWVVAGSCVLVGGDSLPLVIGRVLFWATLAVHLVEFVVMRSVMEKAGGPMSGHFVQTVLYGLFHWKPLRDAQQRAEAPGEAP